MKSKNEKQNTPQDSLKESVLARLEEENIKPRSRYLCLLENYSIWALWGFSIIFGAVSLAVIQFSSLHTGYSLYEATHDSFLELALESLPYLWLLVFILLILAAYYNLRHTKKGYKYKFSHIVLSSLGLSLVGGAVLHAAGIGYHLDTYAGRMSDMYESHEEIELRLWQNSKAGRLVGEYKESDLLFVDARGQEWQVDLSELHENDIYLLQTKDRVRVLGVPDPTTTNLFHLCGVFPWMLKRPPALAELKKDRQAFLERMRQYKPEIEKRIDEHRDRNATSTREKDYCRQMPILKRIKTL